MQSAILQLTDLGPFPSESDADDNDLQARESLLDDIVRPLTNDEARALLRLLGSDNCFGLSWTALHLVETAPDWPLPDCETPRNGHWVALLNERANGHA